MKYRFKGIISIILTVTLLCGTCITANALSISDMEDATLSTAQLADKYLSITTVTKDDGSEIKTIGNIDTLKNKIIAKDKEISDVELAETLYLAIGEDPDVIENLPEEKLLEVLSFTNCIQTTNYIKCDEDGVQTYLSREVVANELAQIDALTNDGEQFLIENMDLVNAGASQRGSIDTDSNDGYLRLTTSAYETTGSMSGRTYYLVSAYAVWLKEPFYKIQDVLAITSTATYDNNYNNYGYFYEQCKEYHLQTGTLLQTYTLNNEIEKDEVDAGNNPDGIWFEYSSGVGGIVLRFDMFSRSYSGSEAHDFEYTMRAYVRFKCSLYGDDGGVQAAYGHRQVSVNGISVDLTSGAIGLSVVGTMAKYYGETLSIYK